MKAASYKINPWSVLDVIAQSHELTEHGGLRGCEVLQTA